MVILIQYKRQFTRKAQYTGIKNCTKNVLNVTMQKYKLSKV